MVEINSLKLSSDNLVVIDEISAILNDYGVSPDLIPDILESLNISGHANKLVKGDYSGLRREVEENFSALVIGKGIDNENLEAARTQILDLLGNN